MNQINIRKNISYKSKVSNSYQLGGIETSILDRGAEKGVNIAWSGCLGYLVQNLP